MSQDFFFFETTDICLASLGLWGHITMLFEVTQPGHHGNIAEWTKGESLLNMEGARSAGHVMWVVEGGEAEWLY